MANAQFPSTPALRGGVERGVDASSSIEQARPPLIHWTARFNTGHAQIDRQHKDLVDQLNGFAAAVDGGDPGQGALFTAFCASLRRHFVYEEGVLRHLGVSDPMLHAHIAHHGDSLQLLTDLESRLAGNSREYSSAVLAEIVHCLLVDLLDEDRYHFVTAAAQPDGERTAPPVAPALHTFGRLFDILNENQQRLVEARDYYLTLLDDFPTPICRADENGHVDWANRTLLGLIGRRQEEVQGEGWFTAIHPEDRETLRSAWTRHVARALPFAAEFRVADASANWRWIYQVGRPFLDANGRFNGYLSTLFDITERKRQEESLRISAAVFEHAREAIMITDAHGRIEAINPAFTRITGFEVGDAVGASANLLRSDFHDASFYSALWQAVISQGRWQGEVINRRKNGEIFPVWLSITTIPGTDGAPYRMVGVFSDLANTRTSQEQLMHLAHHDALTGLPNRLLFSARAQHSLERCAREGSRLAILFIDLNNFKPVNDHLGHKAGDRLLRDVGLRLRGALRSEDTVARFGGDEFVVLVERAEGMDDARCVAEKLLALFPIRASETSDIHVSASIGIALYPEHGNDLATLLDIADDAMYRMKRSGSRP